MKRVALREHSLLDIFFFIFPESVFEQIREWTDVCQNVRVCFLLLCVCMFPVRLLISHVPILGLILYGFTRPIYNVFA